ncbi:MAG: hypothetical protein BroJett038_18680 [Chloroflexota bacterium]|nr:MAG: hypothetical protein BroJett038_18680 [Chloroflexota bacterium]
MKPDSVLLLPRPQEMQLAGGTVSLPDGKLIALAAPRPAALYFMAERARAALERYGGKSWEIVGGQAVPPGLIGLRIALDESIGRAEGYRLVVSADGVTITGFDEAGAFYGVTTFIQLLQRHGADLPALVINDWPDFPNRGVMLDISRDKVPTMPTLYRLVDQLAGWKVNQFQLYTEHTFAYRHHPDVWAKASPMTAQEILALDAYCRERFIDLVPNQNSFGHMHRWFEHSHYLPLAETEGGFTTPWGQWHELPYSLTPANPDTLNFLNGLYDELLPNFTSRYFNVGCDETFDLGLGRSKTLCDEKGRGRVYLDFVLEIYRLVKKRGFTMQFWGDIIGHYPELVPELPRDAVALEWGYEAVHDFDGKCAAFAAAGIPFYVCPGTSSWTAIAGRTDNALGNIRSAVENGLKHGASGVLNTDWGDHGHWQTYPVSLPGFAYGAALSWAYRPNADLDLPAALDAFVFEDSAGAMGRLAYDLGNIYQQPGVLIPNGSVLFWAYFYPLDMLSADLGQWLDWHRLQLQSAAGVPDKLRDTLAHVDRVMSPLAVARMACSDAALITDEFRLAADMLRHGAKRLLFILGEPLAGKNELNDELLAIEARYRDVWLARSRPGGLDDSLARLEKARAGYR